MKVLNLGGDRRLAYYLRPRSSTRRLRLMIGQGLRPAQGLVIDAAHWRQLNELAAVAREGAIETVLETRSLELSSPAALSRSGVSDLPWAGTRAYTVEDLDNAGIRSNLVGAIAEFIRQNGLSAVLAPTHYIRIEDDPWLSVDLQIVADLRRALDERDLHEVPIYYPLYINSRLIRDQDYVRRIAARVSAGPADTVWLGVNNFGTRTASSLTIRWYVNACRQFHLAQLPVVGLHTGVVGIFLMALGALGGIEAGITDGEIFDINQHLNAPPEADPNKRPIGSIPRILIQSLGLYMTEKEVRQFFGQRGVKAAHLCQTGCCPRGLEDMIQNRSEHHVMTTSTLINSLASVPPGLRATWYRDEYLRPAADKAMAASSASPRIEKARRRLDDWRKSLGFQLESGREASQTQSLVPTGARMPRSADAQGEPS